MSAWPVRRVEGPGCTWLEGPPRIAPAPVAWGMIAVGAIVVGFMAFWMSGASGGWRYRSPADLVPIVFGLLGLPGLGFGLLFLALGVGLLRGWSRCCIGVGRDAVLIRERLGILRWTRRVPRGAIAGILLGEGEELRAPLILRRRGQHDLRCAAGYPRAVRQALADALGRLLGGGLAAIRPGRAPPPGNLAVEEADGRLAVSLAGKRGWGVIAAFTLVWLTFVGCFTVGALGLPGGGPAAWGMAAFTLPFWAAGIGLALLCVHRATRRASLLWDGRMLTQVDVSVLRRRIRRWSAAELHDVLVEERGSGSGRYRVVALHQRDGARYDLGEGLDDGAQEWIAARLRLELGLAPSAP